MSNQAKAGGITSLTWEHIGISLEKLQEVWASVLKVQTSHDKYIYMCIYFIIWKNNCHKHGHFTKNIKFHETQLPPTLAYKYGFTGYATGVNPTAQRDAHLWTARNVIDRFAF